MPKNNEETKIYRITPKMRLVFILLVGVFAVFIVLSNIITNHVPVMRNVSNTSLLTNSFYVYFPKSSSDIQTNQNPTMDKAIKDIALDATRAVYVIGNCDLQKSGAYSAKGGDHLLAQNRAQAVSDYLMAHGIPSYSIFIFENGSLTAKPFSNNDNVEIYFK